MCYSFPKLIILALIQTTKYEKAQKTLSSLEVERKKYEALEKSFKDLQTSTASTVAAAEKAKSAIEVRFSWIFTRITPNPNPVTSPNPKPKLNPNFKPSLNPSPNPHPNPNPNPGASSRSSTEALRGNSKQPKIRPPRPTSHFLMRRRNRLKQRP